MQKNPSNSRTYSGSSLDADPWHSADARKDDKLATIAHSAGVLFRVLIVDRDSMSSDLLANALVRDCSCEAIAIQADELIHTLSCSGFDLVVIGAEVRSKSGDGFELAEMLSRLHPETFIVILLNQSSHESVIRAFRSGARGVFSRQQPMSELLDCVEHTRRGFIWAAKEEANSLLEALRNIPAPNPFTSSDSPTLTARELEVVQLAAKGKTNKVIASDLGLSEHTVKNYLFRAFEKLGVSSRVELLFYLTLKGHIFTSSKPQSTDGDLSID